MSREARASGHKAMEGGGKRYKGVPVAWDEVKQNRTIMLTPTAWEILNEKATEMQISRSEVLERLIKGQIAFVGESESLT